jgi:hypothetical protein
VTVNQQQQQATAQTQMVEAASIDLLNVKKAAEEDTVTRGSGTVAAEIIE